MARWALIKGGTVANVVKQDTEPTIGGQWVDITGQHVGPGFTYDGSTFAAPVPTPYERISVGAFWDRFTNGELVDYDVAMQHDPAASNAAKKAAAKLRIFRRDVGEVGNCKLTGNKVRGFVQDLETLGIIAAGRAAAILDVPISEEEKA